MREPVKAEKKPKKTTTTTKTTPGLRRREIIVVQDKWDLRAALGTLTAGDRVLLAGLPLLTLLSYPPGSVYFILATEQL